ncbi:MAG: protein kinase [Planctomycetota bacterium]
MTEPRHSDGAIPLRSSLQLPELFARALALKVHERAALVGSVRSEAPAVARQLEALLAADGIEGHAILDAPLEVMLCPEDWSSDVRAATRAHPASFLGRTIGGMHVTRQIGAGGMGLVFEARQTRPKRSVALKLLVDAAGGLAARLMLEAEALARLDHPSIARVLGAGVDAAAGHDVVWLAVEFVPDALPITAYARAQPLTLSDRVKRVVEVCRAMAHAHGKGVLHRDLKPDNVLVSGGAQAQVKVIDFGLARILDPLDERERAGTRHGELIGTLHYMSPEHCAGDPSRLDVRTDVYGLGIVLFELLTGRLPFDVEGRSILQVIDAIRGPVRASPRAFEPEVDRDLESVVMRATALDPAARYSSAAALGDDLERWLAGHPVAARRAGLAHRSWLFAKRRTGLFAAVSAVAAFALLSSGAIVALALENLRTRDALDLQGRAVADARAHLARVRGALEHLTVDDAEARSKLASIEVAEVRSAEEKRQAVASALEDLDRLAQRLADDPASWAELAAAYARVGELHGTAWQASAADAQGRFTANLRASELWRRILASEPESAMARQALSTSLVRLANSCRGLGEVERGKAFADEAVALSRHVSESSRPSVRAAFDLVEALDARGDLYINDPHPKQGLLDAEEAARVLGALAPSTPAVALQLAERRSWTSLRLGHWLRRDGRPLEGAAMHADSRARRIALIEALIGLAPGTPTTLTLDGQLRVAWEALAVNELCAYRDLGDRAACERSARAMAASIPLVLQAAPSTQAALAADVVAFGVLAYDSSDEALRLQIERGVTAVCSSHRASEPARYVDEGLDVLQRYLGAGFEVSASAGAFLARLRAALRESQDP